MVFSAVRPPCVAAAAPSPLDLSIYNNACAQDMGHTHSTLHTGWFAALVPLLWGHTCDGNELIYPRSSHCVCARVCVCMCACACARTCYQQQPPQRVSMMRCRRRCVRVFVYLLVRMRGKLLAQTDPVRRADADVCRFCLRCTVRCFLLHVSHPYNRTAASNESGQ